MGLSVETNDSGWQYTEKLTVEFNSKPVDASVFNGSETGIAAILIQERQSI